MMNMLLIWTIYGGNTRIFAMHHQSTKNEPQIYIILINFSSYLSFTARKSRQIARHSVLVPFIENLELQKK